LMYRLSVLFSLQINDDRHLKKQCIYAINVRRCGDRGASEID